MAATSQIAKVIETNRLDWQGNHEHERASTTGTLFPFHELLKLKGEDGVEFVSIQKGNN